MKNILWAITAAIILAACVQAKQEPSTIPGDRTAIQAAIARGEATVVFMGDSITSGSDVPYEKSWAGLLERDLREKFPNVRWRFENMSLPGRGIAQANNDNYKGFWEGTADVGYSVGCRAHGWRLGSVAGQSWKDAVRVLNPDQVFLAFGMNDVSGDQNAFRQIAIWLSASLRQAPKPPSIAMVSTLLPSRSAKDYAGLEQNIDATAIAVRAAARESNATLIDANGWYHYLRDGKPRYLFMPFGGAENVLLGPGELIGGNGINHPSIIGHRLIYRQAYQPLLSALK